MAGQRRQPQPDFTQAGNQRRVPAGFGQRGQRARQRRNQLQVVFFQPLQRKAQILLLQFAQQHQVGNEKNAAAGVLEHFLRQRRARRGKVEPRRFRRMERTRADFGHAAAGSFEQEHGGFSRRLFEPPPKILEQGRSGKRFQR